MRTIQTKLLPLEKGQVMLDIGSGRGRHTHAFAYEYPATVIGMDLDQDDLKAANDGWKDLEKQGSGSANMIRGSVYDLPFKDSSVDLIVCSEVFEHLHDYYTCMNEIMRCLKPGGNVAISIPREVPERFCWWLDDGYHRTPGGHIRIFHAPSLRKEMEAVGFNFKHQHYAHGLHSPYWWLRCFLKGKLDNENTDSNLLVRGFHALLVKAMMSQGFWWKLDQWLAPLMGKSVVFYFAKPQLDNNAKAKKPTPVQPDLEKPSVEKPSVEKSSAEPSSAETTEKSEHKKLHKTKPATINKAAKTSSIPVDKSANESADSTK